MFSSVLNVTALLVDAFNQEKAGLLRDCYNFANGLFAALIFKNKKSYLINDEFNVLEWTESEFRIY